MRMSKQNVHKIGDVYADKTISPYVSVRYN